MDQLVLVRIIAIIVYALALAAMAFNVFAPLKTGVLKQWHRSGRVPSDKFPYEGNTAIIRRNDFPKDFWIGIAMRSVMVAVGIWIGFIVYGKLF